MKTIDMNLGISAQAMIVALLLQEDDREIGPIFSNAADVQSRAWYNGRERGISLEIAKEHSLFKERLYVIFAECRSSDQVFVDSYVGSPTMNGPNVHLHHAEREAAYRSRDTFTSPREAADFIKDRVKAYLAG